MSYAEIQKIVTALERPLTNEKIEELNQKIQMYLEEAHCNKRVLNLSFWQTVRYQYWSFMNLTLLLGSKFDVEHGDVLKKFENQLREIQRLRLAIDTPKVPRQVPSVKPRPVVQTTSEPLTNSQSCTPDERQYCEAVQSSNKPVIGNKASESGSATFVSDGVEMTVPALEPDQLTDNISEQNIPSSNNSLLSNNIPVILGCSCIIGLAAWYVFRNFNITNTQ